MAAPELDDQELLHLAIRASNENRHEDAIGYLKRALDLSPKNAKVHYMLGAEHAEIGMYDRATAEIAKAVELDPTLVTAHFQLGLLYITSGHIAEADVAWKPLDKLGADDPLYLFKTGMLHLVKDEFDACIKAIEKGLQLNKQNLALNRDMKRVLDDVRTRMPGGTTPPAPTTPGKTEYPKDVRLTAYRQGADDKT